ncbi:MAG: hypothetical protein WKF94_01540 [Solirubrobacteraceae bacterium]
MALDGDAPARRMRTPTRPLGSLRVLSVVQLSARRTMRKTIGGLLNPQRLILMLAAWALLAPAAAVAAVPVASTGDATKVTATTATLTGTVNPNGEDTTYFFEYGTTTARGTTTPVQTVAAKGKPKDVAVDAAISGLSPNTLYHFRLVATNPSGTAAGNDKTFTTAPPYNVPGPGPGPGPGATALSCAASPVRVTFGRSTTISGRLTGPNSGGVKVQLEEDPVPYADGFKKVGSEVTTDNNGKFSVAVKPTVNTRYQAVAKSSPPVACAAVQVLVRHRVTLRVNDRTAFRGQRVRFRGAVAPADVVGRKVRIQRRTKSGSFRTVAKAKLRAAGSRAVYRKRLRIFRTGTYRVKVGRDARHISGVSRKRTIRVR